MSVIAVNSDAPVSVKCRIGVDDHDSYDELCKILLLISLSIRVRGHQYGNWNTSYFYILFIKLNNREEHLEILNGYFLSC